MAEDADSDLRVVQDIEDRQAERDQATGSPDRIIPGLVNIGKARNMTMKPNYVRRSQAASYITSRWGIPCPWALCPLVGTQFVPTRDRADVSVEAPDSHFGVVRVLAVQLARFANEFSEVATLALSWAATVPYG